MRTINNDKNIDIINCHNCSKFRPATPSKTTKGSYTDGDGYCLFHKYILKKEDIEAGNIICNNIYL